MVKKVGIKKLCKNNLLKNRGRVPLFLFYVENYLNKIGKIYIQLTLNKKYAILIKIYVPIVKGILQGPPKS